MEGGATKKGDSFWASAGLVEAVRWEEAQACVIKLQVFKLWVLV